MTFGDTEPDELEKLLADVQRTIRDNDQFIRHLKEETAGSAEAGMEEEAECDVDTDIGDYVEL